MKPNFALSLSYDGIVLLHRVGSGWSRVGEVALDAADLASQLAVLRKTGLALDSQALRTKVLIPNDQIRYLALDTTRAAEDDIRRALDRVTPYAVDDLVYDYVRGGGRTYIAAVARETLAEAEAFAAEHRFGPVCFAAVPEPFTYVGEAWFGPTRLAERLLGPGQKVDRDEVAVTLLPKARPVEPRVQAGAAVTPKPVAGGATGLGAPRQTEPGAGPERVDLPEVAVGADAAGGPGTEGTGPDPEAMDRVQTASDAKTTVPVGTPGASPTPPAPGDAVPTAESLSPPGETRHAPDTRPPMLRETATHRKPDDPTQEPDGTEVEASTTLTAQSRQAPPRPDPEQRAASLGSTGLPRMTPDAPGSGSRSPETPTEPRPDEPAQGSYGTEEETLVPAKANADSSAPGPTAPEGPQPFATLRATGLPGNPVDASDGPVARGQSGSAPGESAGGQAGGEDAALASSPGAASMMRHSTPPGPDQPRVTPPGPSLPGKAAITDADWQTSPGQSAPDPAGPVPPRIQGSDDPAASGAGHAEPPRPAQPAMPQALSSDDPRPGAAMPLLLRSAPAADAQAQPLDGGPPGGASDDADMTPAVEPAPLAPTLPADPSARAGIVSGQATRRKGLSLAADPTLISLGLFDSQIAATLALPNLPGQTLEDTGPGSNVGATGPVSSGTPQVAPSPPASSAAAPRPAAAPVSAHVPAAPSGAMADPVAGADRQDFHALPQADLHTAGLQADAGTPPVPKAPVPELVPTSAAATPEVEPGLAGSGTANVAPTTQPDAKADLAEWPSGMDAATEVQTAQPEAVRLPAAAAPDATLQTAARGNGVPAPVALSDAAGRHATINPAGPTETAHATPHAVAAAERPEAPPVAVTDPGIATEPAKRPPLVPEPVFASRARPLRSEALVLPPAILGHSVVRTAQGGERAEPIFSRRADPSGKPHAQPALPPLAAVSGARPAAKPVTSPPPRLTVAARPAPDTPRPTPDASRPVTDASRLAGARAGGAPAVTIQPRLAGVAATVIPFRPAADSGTGATAVSIETVTLTRPLPGAAPQIMPVPAAGSFASIHGKNQVLPGTAAKPAAGFRQRPSVGGKPRYLALILTLILLACLAALAYWATFISESSIAALFGRAPATEVVSTGEALAPLQPEVITGSALPQPEAAAPLAPQADPPAEAEAAAVVVSGPLPPDAVAEPALPEVVLGPSLDTLLPEAVPPEAVLPEAVPPEAVLPEAVPPEAVLQDTLPPEAPLPDSLEPATPPDQAATPVPAAPGTMVSPAEADRFYAATGVWLRAPRLALIPVADPVGALARATLDAGTDRLALPGMPPVAGALPDPAMVAQPDPPPPGTVFARDARGFVLATPEGTLTPNGIVVYAGQPAVVPPNRPGSAVAVPPPADVAAPPPADVAAPPPADVAAVAAPPLAPRDTQAPAVAPDSAELLDAVLATAGGVGLSALQPVQPLARPETDVVAAPADVVPVALPAFVGPRPVVRPQDLAPDLPAASDVPDILPVDPAVAPAVAPAVDPALTVADTVAAILAAAPPDPLATATPLAISSARIPEPRPQNFAAVVASAQERSAAAAETPTNASLAVVTPQVQVAPAVVAPSGPVSGDVATAATLEEAIDLRGVNLIGVFGRPNDRRALVRLGNGRYVRVGVGDSLDGGQVAAIGDNALNYVKRGQTITIAIPNG